MSPLDKLKGKPVPEITTEQLQRAGAFGVAVPSAPRHPRYGERWVKPSAPVPTVVTIMTVDAEWVSVRLGSRPTGRIKTLTIASFLEQGFRPEDATLSQNEALTLFEGPRKPVDERISDAFDRLVTLAGEAEDEALGKCAGILAALWMVNLVPMALDALRPLAPDVDSVQVAAAERVQKGGSDADHE